jgi:ceramide glucosyltransferase
MLPNILILAPALLTSAALGFLIANLLALWHWRKQKSPPAFAVPVSILKPLKGCDPEMYEAFRSHCCQDYAAAYEIIFGTNAADDEAVPFVKQLQTEFPSHAIKLIAGGEMIGANGKVSNIARMLQQAQYAHVLINDSDILVPPTYLRDVMAWFRDPQVGMVTCLYRARPGKTVWSKLEALGVLADFMPGALTARMLEGKVRFGLGSTMAVDRKALEAIGGIETLADYLADDYELGSRICDSGRRVVVPAVVVETSTPDYTFTDFWRHQLRWGRTVRSSRPGGYVGLVMTFALLWAMITAGASGALWAWWLLIAVVVTRVLVIVVYGTALRDPARRYVWLFPVRDLISPVVWLCSLVGSKIYWRGEEFTLKRGKLQRVTH